MRVHKLPFFRQMKTSLVLITAIIILLITSLAYLFYSSSRHNYQEKALTGILGRQRMYSQMVAKDAGRLYILMLAHSSEDKAFTATELHSEILQSKTDILDARDGFSAVLDQISNGFVMDGEGRIPFNTGNTVIQTDLNSIKTIWNDFEQSIDVLSHSESIDAEFDDAIKYINENNVTLLSYCDKLLTDVIVSEKQSVNANAWIAASIAAISFVLLGISAYKIFKYSINPLTELYKGFSEIGATSLYLQSEVLTKKDVRPVVEEVGNVFRKTEKLLSLIENINSNHSFGEVLEYIFTSFSPFIPYNYIGVALLKNNGDSIEASYGISDRTIDGLPGALFKKEYTISETSLGNIIKSGSVRIINSMETYVKDKPVKEYTEIIMKAGIRSSITLPLNINNKPIGLIFFSSDSSDVYNEEHVQFLKAIANSIAISFDKYILLDELLYSSLLALTKLAEARDQETGYHLDRIKFYSRTIAQCLYTESSYKDQITVEFINDVEKFSPMHDIGKVGVNDRILLKPMKLSNEEFEEMKKHTIFGAEVLKTAEKNMESNGKSIFKMGIEIAESHHEKWDGSGYPYGRKGTDIPLSARIVAIADVFDALTSRRPYKDPYSFDKSFEIILEGSGTHFDPEIARVFERNRQVFLDLYSGFNAD